MIARIIRHRHEPAPDREGLGPNVASSAPGQLWATVLAAAEDDARFQPSVDGLSSEDRSRHVASALVSCSRLGRTLAGIARLIPPARTIVVAHRNNRRVDTDSLEGEPVARLLAHSSGRATAADVLLPMHLIDWRDPQAIVAVFRCDRFTREEQAFIAHIIDAVELVREYPGWIVLLGAAPTDADAAYSWIEPGELLAWSPAGYPVSRVRQLHEQPAQVEAGAGPACGWLWNTFAFVARVSLFLQTERHFFPELHTRLSQTFASDDIGPARRVLQRAYAHAGKASLSRLLFILRPPPLAVLRLPPLRPSDAEAPERVVTRSLQESGTPSSSPR